MFYLIWPSPALIIIPLLVYHFVRIWLQEEVSKYPDIDQIWFNGVEQAQAIGIRIDYSPLFIVLGTTSPKVAGTLLKNAGQEVTVQSPPGGDGPISFFANKQAIFVFLHSCSCLSTQSKAPARVAKTQETGGGTVFSAGGTVDASFFQDYKTAASEHVPSSGTVMIDADSNAEVIAGGTMLMEDFQDSYTSNAIVSSVQSLTSKETEACRDKMIHLCNLLKKARGAICPMNGMLTTLQFDIVETSSGPLQVALQRDVKVLREELKVRVANTVLVTGMETDLGFHELMSRFKPNQLHQSRFGKGSDMLWTLPGTERLQAICANACGQFEDWIYLFFQSSPISKRSTNGQLFKLLCRVRGGFGESLASLVSGGLGVNIRTDPQLAKEQFLFGGCYFAATGNSSSDQAFVRKVIDKMVDQQGELEWLPQALEQDRRFLFYGNIAALVGLMSLASIAGMIAYYVYHQV